MRSARALGHDSHHLVDQESGCQASATENRRLVAVSRGAPIGRRPVPKAATPAKRQKASWLEKCHERRGEHIITRSRTVTV